MTGAAVSACAGKTVPPPTPHSNSITLTGGDTYTVSTASGNLYALFSSQISASDSGGVPPYSNSPGETLSIVASSAGATAFIMNPGITNNSVGFSGLSSSGNFVAFTISYGSVDSLGAQANSTYPGSGQVIIQRA